MNAKNTILIAEDDPAVRNMLLRALGRHADRVETRIAADGAEAIKILSTVPIRLLITDLRMPSVDGLTLLSHIHNHYPEMPCIVMTAFAADERELEILFRCYQPNIKDLANSKSLCFFKKPFNVQKLVSVVLAHLNHQACDGILSGISIASFIQLIAMEEKTCSVEVTTRSGEVGSLYFFKGKLTDADYQQHDAEEAAVRIMAFENPKIAYTDQYKKSHAGDRNIRSTAMALLLEASRRKDDSG
jgi:CheY-like chemotaxis protein